MHSEGLDRNWILDGVVFAGTYLIQFLRYDINIYCFAVFFFFFFLLLNLLYWFLVMRCVKSINIAHGNLIFVVCTYMLLLYDIIKNSIKTFLYIFWLVAKVKPNERLLDFKHHYFPVWMIYLNNQFAQLIAKHLLKVCWPFALQSLSTELLLTIKKCTDGT